MARVKPNISAEGKLLAAYMVRNRSINDIIDKMDLTREDVKKSFNYLRSFGYEICECPTDFHGDPTYVAVPRAQSLLPLGASGSRLWSWELEGTGQPYGIVKFPSEFTPPKIKIVPLDGILYGDGDHDAKRFDVLLERIKLDPDTFVFLNGDVIGEVKGGSREDRESRLLEHTSEFVRKIAPISHKILWAQQGCLEARSLKNQGFDPLAYCCSQLRIPYFTEPCYIDILWGKHAFTLWAMHGNSTAPTKGAKMNALRRPAVMHDLTNFMVGGHIGDAMWNRVIKICRDPVQGKLVPREEFHVILGNFKKYLGTKAARRGHTPSSTDTLVFCLCPDGTYHVKSSYQSESLPAKGP